MSTEATTHVHYRPGGAVFEVACGCGDEGAWPPGPATVALDDGWSVTTGVIGDGDEDPLPEPARRAYFGGVAQALARAWRSATRGAARVALAHVRVSRQCGSLALAALVWLWAVVLGTLRVVGAIIRGLGNGAQVAGVAVAAWAAWEIDPVAGRLVLAAGLLFLGGAISRVVREVRNGSR